MATPSLWGSQFLINTTVKSNQLDASLHALKDGSFVAVWTDYSRDDSNTDDALDIRGQILNADGSKRGGEFLVNTSTADDQSKSEVAVLNDGRFVVTWLNQAGSESIQARVFNPNGTAATGEIKVSTGSLSYEGPSVTALSNGGFAIAYVDGGRQIWAQSFNSSLQQVKDSVQISADDNRGYQPAAVGLNGRFGVFFRDERGEDAIRGRFVSNEGTALADVSEFGMTSKGGSVRAPEAAKLADGRTVLVWKEEDKLPNSTLKAQILNVDGSKSGGAITIRSVSSDVGYIGDAAITASADGGFAVAYQSKASGENTAELRLASFNSKGGSTGAHLLVDRWNGGEHTVVTTLADGRMALAWNAYYSNWDNNGNGVHSQIVDARQKAVSLAGTSADDHFVGSRFGDKLGGGSGNDKLAGGLGRDTLKGGAGRDVFVFDTKASKSSTDKILDFNAKQDKIYLDNDVFKGLGSKGSAAKPWKLDKKAFWTGSKAHDANDRLILDKQKGVLLFDEDGTGGKGAIQIATLSKNLKHLDAGDFFII